MSCNDIYIHRKRSNYRPVPNYCPPPLFEKKQHIITPTYHKALHHFFEK